MKSHEVLKNAFDQSSPKAIASNLGVSLSLVYKWAQNQEETGSGSRNPLDRIVEIYENTGHLPIIEWLCEQCDGYFVKNPTSNQYKREEYNVLPATHEIVGQFSNLLNRISQAALDNSITADEAAEIRQSWDHLKSYAEGFVRCCEMGDFEKIPKSNQTPDEKDKKNPIPRQTLY